jgi:single-strand DNA-binding protein
MNLNHVFILGRMTKAPELKTTTSGHAVTSFSVATNRVYVTNGQKQEETEFHNIVCWGRQAEIASQFLVKGALVLIEGRLKTRKWVDKQSGQTRYATDIVCENLTLGPKSGQASQSKPQQPDEDESDGPIINIEEDEIRPEDLPF